jgi:adenosylmethionine-8-amino-7-oxononanoate aminotransferase
MEKSIALAKDRNYVWHPFTQMQTAGDPLYIERAEATTLFAADGKTYIDANSSWWVTVHGHGHPYLAQAVYNQFIQLDHVIFAGATHPQAITLSERIVQLLPEPLQKVFFSDDGSTAVEVALKMAFQYWHNRGEDRKRIIALDGAYHGDTFGAMSIGQRGVFNKPFEHLFFDVDFIAFPSEENRSIALQQAEKVLMSGEVAAIIVEPLVQGSAGMRMYDAPWLDAFVRLAKKHRVLVIFDEVMTGWGRTGKLFAHNFCEESPDIICLSKGLTGGVLPLGLTVATDEIYNAFLHPETTKALLHGHSFTGNALACAAANASLDLFQQPETWDAIEWIEERHRFFIDALKAHPKVKDIGLCGTILRFEVSTGEGNNYFSSIRDQAYHYFLERGCLIRPLGNVIYLNPPYCISEEELDQLHVVLLDFLDDLNF